MTYIKAFVEFVGLLIDITIFSLPIVPYYKLEWAHKFTRDYEKRACLRRTNKGTGDSDMLYVFNELMFFIGIPTNLINFISGSLGFWFILDWIKMQDGRVPLGPRPKEIFEQERKEFEKEVAAREAQQEVASIIDLCLDRVSQKEKSFSCLYIVYQ